MQPQIRASQLTNETSFTRVIEGHDQAGLRFRTIKSKSRINEWHITTSNGNLQIIASNGRGANISHPIVIANNGKHLNLSVELIRTSADLCLLKSNPFLSFENTAGTLNNKKWYIGATDNKLIFNAVGDAGNNSVSWLTVERDQTDILNIDFNSVNITHNGNRILSQETGSFEAAIVGLSKPPPHEIAYVKTGDHVTLMVPAIIGMSNSTEFCITNIPSNLQPRSSKTNTQATAMCTGMNDGTTIIVWAQLKESSPRLVFHNQLAGWSDKDVKGIDGFSITYMV